MSDKCVRVSTDRVEPVVTRRAVLGGLALTGSLATTGSSAEAASAPARNIRLHRFDGTIDFAQGRKSGVSVGGELALLGRSRKTGQWTSPRLSAGFPVTEIVPSWNAHTPPGTWIEIAVSARTTSGEETGWFVLGRWCEDNPAEGGAIQRASVEDQETKHASVWTDTLAAESGVTLESYVLRTTLHRKAGAASPRVRLLSVMASALPDVDTVATSAPGAGVGRVLNVPTLSQEVHAGHYPEWDSGGEAWCSPTSVAMVADYFKVGPSAAETAWIDVPPDEQVDHAARQTFDFAYEGCGNWPFNTAYAATLGLRGFITRMRSLREAEGFIAAGLPLVLSMSFKKENMAGAGYSTSGHLMVLVGFAANGDPVMNDPASHLIPDNDEVRVTYRRGQVENAWLPHSGGVAYVLYPEGKALPPAPAQANW